jgi:hypothetical protein
MHLCRELMNALPNVIEGGRLDWVPYEAKLQQIAESWPTASGGARPEELPAEARAILLDLVTQHKRPAPPLTRDRRWGTPMVTSVAARAKSPAAPQRWRPA